MRHIIEMIWKMGTETEQNRSPITRVAIRVMAGSIQVMPVKCD